ncbi:hypothetical protein FBULB1_12621 [Fusarium bulbicola]|nr:hypothetical protein FBULB1_12621 [Fusarium bulbicola]
MDIKTWASIVAEETSAKQTESATIGFKGQKHKRRKLNAEPLTPPLSAVVSMPSPSKKRSRDSDETSPSEEAREQITPRPSHVQQVQTTDQIPFSTDSSHGSQSHAPSVSSHSVPVLKYTKTISSRSSSSRQIRHAEINETGFKIGSFQLESYPDSLRALRGDLANIGLGYSILPASREPELRRASPEIPPFAFDRDEATRAQTEIIAADLPPIRWVQDFMKRAIECQFNRECETSWNAEVHGKILERAFRKPSNLFMSDGPVDFRYSQAAQIIHEYKPREAPSKMVDFCVFYGPEEGSEAEQAIEEICRTRPAQSINHTDLGYLCKRPIALSIETKRPNLELDNATLQMGTWQSAQWRSLQYKRSPSFRPFDFLPGIIVQGHDWKFVASILGKTKPVLLMEVRLGGTDSVLAIYSLISGLRRLRRWIMEDYWPTFVSSVLGISDTDSTNDT